MKTLKQGSKNSDFFSMINHKKFQKKNTKNLLKNDKKEKNKTDEEGLFYTIMKKGEKKRTQQIPSHDKENFFCKQEIQKRIFL